MSRFSSSMCVLRCIIRVNDKCDVLGKKLTSYTYKWVITYWVKATTDGVLNNTHRWAWIHSILLKPSPTGPSLIREGLVNFVSIFSLRYVAQKFVHSSIRYPFAIDASGRALLRTYLFNVFIYLSIGYIHLNWTGPPSRASLVKCMVRWTMTSKNAGGKIFSKWHNVTAILSCKPFNSSIRWTLEQSCLKKLLTSINVLQHS